MPQWSSKSIVGCGVLLFALAALLFTLGCGGLKAENEKLKKDVADLSGENEKLKADVSRRTSESSTLHSQLAELNLQISTLQTLNQTLQNEIDALKAQLKGKKKK